VIVWPAWPDEEPTDADLQALQEFIARLTRSEDPWEATPT
jgi:hypothetical protein